MEEQKLWVDYRKAMKKVAEPNEEMNGMIKKVQEDKVLNEKTKEIIISRIKKSYNYLPEEETTSYTDAKQTAGKIDLTTVPPAIIESIAKVREHAINGKYKDPENWRKVPWEEYWRAMLRHTLAMWRDPMGYDEDSGLLHLDHVACNAAFILEMWKGEDSE